MRTKSKTGLHRFQLKVLGYGNSYYIERIAELEAALAKRLGRLQIDMVGEGEIPADWALLIRSVLNQRSPKTRVITNARSSLQNGSVLVWLSGDSRMIRADARVFFRRATVTEDGETTPDGGWKEGGLEYQDSYSETDPEEADHARVLKAINEFLPVKELAGRLVEVPVLRQFGLVENEKLDRFLATAFGRPQQPDDESPGRPKARRVRVASKTKQVGK
jgi:hypothetical protein